MTLYDHAYLGFLIVCTAIWYADGKFELCIGACIFGVLYLAICYADNNTN